MASTEIEIAVVPQQQQQQVVKKQKKLKPARKQVTPGQVEKKEAPQTGKEYSTCNSSCTSLEPIIDASRGQISGTISGLEVIEKTATQSTCSSFDGPRGLAELTSRLAKPNPKPAAT